MGLTNSRMAAWYSLSTLSMLRLGSFLLWTNVYFYVVENFPNKSAEWCTRVVTLFHGIVAVLVGWRQCSIGLLQYTDCIPSNYTSKILPTQYALMLWSWGYFAFDLLWCAVYWTEGSMMLFHHLVSLCAITLCMQQENTGGIFPCYLVIMELTNPLLQIRWFLKKEGYEKTNILCFIEVLYFALFIFLRGIVGTYGIYWALTTECFSRELKILSIGLYIVSLGFVYQSKGLVCFFAYNPTLPQSKSRAKLSFTNKAYHL